MHRDFDPRTPPIKDPPAYGPSYPKHLIDDEKSNWMTRARLIVSGEADLPLNRSIGSLAGTATSGATWVRCPKSPLPRARVASGCLRQHAKASIDVCIC